MLSDTDQEEQDFEGSSEGSDEEAVSSSSSGSDWDLQISGDIVLITVQLACAKCMPCWLQLWCTSVAIHVCLYMYTDVND